MKKEINMRTNEYKYKNKDIHVPDTLLPNMDDQKDEAYWPTMMFLFGIGIGIGLGLAIYYAFTR